MAKRIDIVVKDKIDDSVVKKIQSIAKAAKEAQHSINLMQKALSGLQVGTVNKLATAQQNLSRSQDSITKSAKAASQELPKLAATINKVVGASSAMTGAARESARAYNKVFDTIKTKEFANAFQQDINKILGVQDKMSKSARESFGVFEQTLKAQEVAAKKFATSYQQEINKVLGVQDKVAKSAKDSFMVLDRAQERQARQASAVSAKDTRAAESATKALAASVANLEREFNPLGAEVQRLEGALTTYRTALDKGVISQEQFARSSAETLRQLQATEAQLQKVSAAQTTGTAGAISASRGIRQQRQALQNLSFQLNDIGVSLASGQNPFTVLIQQGSQIAQIYGIENGVRGVFRGLATDLGGFAKALRGPLVIVAALGAGFSALQKRINATSKVQVSFADTLRATFSVVIGLITDAAKPLTDVLAPAFQFVTKTVVDLGSFIGKSLVGGITTLVSNIATVLGQLPKILGAVVQQVGAALIIGITGYVNDAIDLINKLNSVADKAINRVNVFSDKNITVGRLSNISAPDAAIEAEKLSLQTFDGLLTQFGKNAERVSKIDVFGKIKDKAVANALEKTKEEMEKLQKAVEAIFNNSKRAFESLGFNEYQKAISDINNTVADLVTQYGALNAQQLALVESAKQYAIASVDFRRNEDVEKLLKGYKDGFDTQGLDDFDKALFEINTQVDELTKRYGALTPELNKLVAKSKEYALQTVAYERIRSIVEETATPVETLNRELTEINKLRPFAKNAEDVEALNRKVQELIDGVDESAQIFKDFATDIGNRSTDLFQGVLSGGKNTFRSIFDDAYSGFTRLMARMLTLAVARPIIIPVVQSVGSALGASQGSIKAVAKQFGVNDISGLSGLSSIGRGLSNPLFSTGSGIARALDSVGASLGLSGGIAQGPTLSGAAGYSTGISSSFTTGAALGGIGGNLLAGALFGNNRGIGATAGGTVGGIAGTILSGGNPLGAALGSFVGNAIGGLFGNNKPSDKTQTGTIDLSTGAFTNRRGLEGKKFSQENFDAVTQLGEIFAGIGGALNSKDSLSLIVGNRDGLRFQRNGGAVQKANDPGSFIQEIVSQLNQGAPKVSESLSTALKNIDFATVKDNLEGVISDINFAIAFDDLDFVPEEVSQIVAEFENLNTIFDEAQSTAKRLGLEEKKVIDKRKEAIADFIKEFNDSNRNAIFSNILPQFEQLLALEDERQQSLKDAAKIGADTSLVQLRYQSELEAILAQNFVTQSGILEQEQERLRVAQDLSKRFSSVVENFDDILFELDVGRFTAKDPVTRIDDFRAIIDDLSKRSLLNDVDAQERLAEILPDFLQLSEETYGASEQFGKDLELVAKISGETRSAAQRQIDIQTQIAASAQKQVELLQTLTTLGNTDQRFISGSFTGQSFSRDNPNEILSRAVAAGVIDNRTADALTRSSGFYGTPGEKRASAFFASNADAADALFRALQAAGISGYATGGAVTGGVPNRDSVPIMAMPGEYVIRAQSARNVGQATLNYINSTGSVPSGSANDNTDVVAAINRQTEVLARMGDKLIELETRVVNNTSNGSREAGKWL